MRGMAGDCVKRNAHSFDTISEADWSLEDTEHWQLP